jgi:Rrf2 family iron-sulfur cluster assembly transcriptional regulator
MRLTTKGRFAVTAMVDLALRPGRGPLTLAGISQRQKISVSYLEQLFGKLRRRGLVSSVRGPGGGYCLAKDTTQISVADIMLAVDESIDATQCGGKENCHDDHTCITHDLWANLNQHILDYLGAVTLKQLVDEQKARQDGAAQVIFTNGGTDSNGAFVKGTGRMPEPSPITVGARSGKRPAEAKEHL